MRYASILAAVVLAVAFSSARAQAPDLRTATLDLTVGRHSVNGGLFDYNPGGIIDLFLAGAAKSNPSRAIVIGGGASGVFGGFGDRCLFKPGGGCAPQANFVAFNALAGIDWGLGGPSVRALVGPSIYKGEDATSVGLQGRLDLLSPAVIHTGLGLMLRATVLPSHGGQTLVAWAIGASLIGR